MSHRNVVQYAYVYMSYGDRGRRCNEQNLFGTNRILMLEVGVAILGIDTLSALHVGNCAGSSG